MRGIITIVSFALACYLMYHVCDSLRCAFTGAHTKTAQPNPNPESFRPRAAAFVLGVIALALAQAAFHFLFFTV
jgi:succinate dehydrogenase/fumarate reductase cytochrome b subunit